MANVLIVATGEFCDPVVLLIRVETSDRSLHRPRLPVLSGGPAMAPPPMVIETETQSSTWRAMEGQRSLYEAGVTESLWEVAQMASCARIDLFAVKPEWGGKRHQLLHQVRCLLILSRPGQCLNEPKGARHERSLGAFEEK
jgi:hypothetical protein